jgi:hypothetical protein
MTLDEINGFDDMIVSAKEYGLNECKIVITHSLINKYTNSKVDEAVEIITDLSKYEKGPQ